MRRSYWKPYHLQIVKASREPVYKWDNKEAILIGKNGSQYLEVVSIVNHKQDPNSNERVTVGNNGVPDFVFFSFCNGSVEDTNMKMTSYAKFHERNTKPYKQGSPKPKARVVKIVNPINTRHLDIKNSRRMLLAL